MLSRERRTHPKGEPAVDDPEIGVSLGERRAGAFADAPHPDPEDDEDEKAHGGIDDDQVRVLDRVGMQEVSRGVEDGAGAYSSHKNAFHRGHERLVLSVAELVAVVGRLADLACDEDGQAATTMSTIADIASRLIVSESEYMATRIAAAANRMTRRSDSCRARSSCDVVLLLTAFPWRRVSPSGGDRPTPLTSFHSRPGAIQVFQRHSIRG